MPKLYSSRIIITTLRRAGFLIVSQKGSHIKMRKTQADMILTTIIPNHKEVARGTFKSILEQAKMTEIEFKRFLK